VRLIAPRDAFLVTRLREAGAVILGKANMTEWANFMTTGMPAGYSSRGGQVRNPYGESLSPGGSSSGSAVAVAADLCTVAVGTETSGSILSPANQNSVVGIKPTLVSSPDPESCRSPEVRTRPGRSPARGRRGHCPGRHDGRRRGRPCHAREPSPRAARLHGVSGDAGARGRPAGVPRAAFFDRLGAAEVPVIEAALQALGGLGSILVDPADIATAREVADFRSDVMLYEFKRDLNRYLGGLGEASSIRSLRDLIRFNETRPREMLRFGQVLLLAAQATSGLGTATYRLSRAEDIRLSRAEGVDQVMARERLDALVFPGWTGAAIGAKAGYPSVIVPAGYTAEGAPVGLTFLGRAWSEPTFSAWPTRSSAPPVIGASRRAWRRTRRAPAGASL